METFEINLAFNMRTKWLLQARNNQRLLKN